MGLTYHSHSKGAPEAKGQLVIHWGSLSNAFSGLSIALTTFQHQILVCHLRRTAEEAIGAICVTRDHFSSDSVSFHSRQTAEETIGAMCVTRGHFPSDSVSFHSRQTAEETIGAMCVTRGHFPSDSVSFPISNIPCCLFGHMPEFFPCTDWAISIALHHSRGHFCKHVVPHFKYSSAVAILHTWSSRTY
jgi:hypothetical protein